MPAVAMRTPVAIQTASWVRLTAPTPRILPSMRCHGFIDEITTSTMRLVFSSSVARMTATA